MIKEGRIKSECMDTSFVCGIFSTAKQVRKMFNTSDAEISARESRREDSIVCSDVVVPITPATKSGFRYVVTFIMIKSRYVMIYPLR